MRPEFYLTLKFLNQACIPTQQKAVVSRALSWKSPLESCALPSSSPAPRRIQLGLTQVTGLAPSAAVQTATPPGTAQWDAAECTEPCPGWTRVTLLHTQYCSENAAAQRGQVFDVTTFPNICKMLWFDILLFEKGTTNSANTISAVNHPCDRLSLCSNTFSSKCWEVKTPSKKPGKPMLNSRCAQSFASGFVPVCPSSYLSLTSTCRGPGLSSSVHCSSRGPQAASDPIWCKYQPVLSYKCIGKKHIHVHQVARTKEPQAIICVRRLSLTSLLILWLQHSRLLPLT